MIPAAVSTAQDLLLIGPLANRAGLAVFSGKSWTRVAVDGGIAAAPDAALWLGDGDSGVPPDHIPSILKPTQDMTDLQFTLETLRAGAWRRLHLAGFTGGRMDHALANIGVIDAEMRVRDSFEQAVVYRASGAVAWRHFAAGAQSFRSEGLFSLLTVSAGEVSLSGACAYPAHRLALPPLSPRGISNVGDGEIRVESSVPFIVLFPDEEGAE